MRVKVVERRWGNFRFPFFILAFLLSHCLWAQSTVNLPQETELTRFQRRNVSQWTVDQGSSLQIQDLLFQLNQVNSNLEEAYEENPDEFRKILDKKNITVKTNYGKATRINLKTKEGAQDLVCVTLFNSRGEEIDVVLADFKVLSPDSPDFHVYLTQKMVYDPSDTQKNVFGKSVFLVNANWKNQRDVAQKLFKSSDTLFFPKGRNLRAWFEATIFRPRASDFVMNLPSTAFQVGWTYFVASAARDYGISDTPPELPTMLSAMYSALIGFNLRTYAVLTKLGSEMKKFTFNFVGTSLSYAIILNLWDIGTHFFKDAARVAFIVVNGIAGNTVKGAIYHFANVREDSGIVEGDYAIKIPFTRNPETGEQREIASSKTQFQREFLYSGIANQLRLVDLIAGREASGGGGLNNGTKLGIKAGYIAFASMVYWCLTRYTEIVAANARNNPEAAKHVDIAKINQHAAKLRRNLEEFKAAINRRIPLKAEFFAGHSLEDFDHKKVNELFLKWNAAKAAYVYRLNPDKPVPQAELARYRSEMIDDMVQLTLESGNINTLEGVEVASSGELTDFMEKGGRRQLGAIEYAATKLAAAQHIKHVPATEEYGDFLSELVRKTAAALKDSKSKYPEELKRRVVGFINVIVKDFPKNAGNLNPEYYAVTLPEKLGAYAGKAVEHYTSRLIMWRYLYTARIPSEIENNFIRMVNSPGDEFLKWIENTSETHGRILRDYEAQVTRGNVDYQLAASHKKEMSEVRSLLIEMQRRIKIKLKKSGKQKIDQRMLGKFQDELVAFQALTDFRKTHDIRWPKAIRFARTSPVPEPLWSYNQSKGARNPVVPRGPFRQAIYSAIVSPMKCAARVIGLAKKI